MSNTNQSTNNNSVVSNNMTGNSTNNYIRSGQGIINFQDNRNNKFPIKNNYIEENRNLENTANTNYNNYNNGVLTNNNINNIINRKRYHNQMIGIENATKLNNQEIKIIDINEQNFKTPLNHKNDQQYDFQVKKFKY